VAATTGVYAQKKNKPIGDVLRAASPTQETADPGPALWQPYTLSYPVSAGLFLCAESAPELSRRCALARD